MNTFDVVWSGSQQQWVVREARLRWVGDVFGARGLDQSHAERVAVTANKIAKDPSLNLQPIVRAHHPTERAS